MFLSNCLSLLRPELYWSHMIKHETNNMKDQPAAKSYFYNPIWGPSPTRWRCAKCCKNCKFYLQKQEIWGQGVPHWTAAAENYRSYKTADMEQLVERRLNVTLTTTQTTLDLENYSNKIFTFIYLKKSNWNIKTISLYNYKLFHKYDSTTNTYYL